MFRLKFILRDVNRTRSQAVVFTLCVSLAILTLVAVNGFSVRVNTALYEDARALHAADIIVRANQEPSTGLIQKIEQLQEAGSIRAARIYEFYSVARTAAADASLLSNVKAVSREYPFYGTFELASGRPLHEVLQPGRAVVAPALLKRLGLQVGEKLAIGRGRLVIADVVLKEPDRPLDAFAFGPRIVISTADLDRIDLIREGSRVRHAVLVKVAADKDLTRLVTVLSAAADPVQERVDTYRTAPSRVKRFFDNFIYFLNLIGVFTQLLAGIGIYTTLTAYLKEKEKTIAVMKTVGASGGVILSHFTLSLVLLSLVGTGLGLLLGLAAQNVFSVFIPGILPRQNPLTLSWVGVWEGFGMGFLVVALFAFLPLYRLRKLRPAVIFRKEESQPASGLPYFLALLIIGTLFGAMVLWHLQVGRSGVLFVLAAGGFILATAAITHGVLLVLRRLPVKSLTLRQALKGLFRPRNATRPIIVTLTASLAVVFTIYGIENNLDRTYVQAYPSDAPNLFFLDIQPDQLADFDRELGIDTRYFPIVRARILSINGNPIDRHEERQRRRGDNLARTFNLTFRADLLDDERVAIGDSLFRADWAETQVSVLDMVVKMHDLKIGDRIVFRVQGIPLEARVSSIRSRTKDSIKPFFYFVFQEDTLKDAPQTIFTAVRVEKNRIADVQTAMVKKFPNVSVIDMTETITTLAGISRKLSNTIRFFTAFGILAGLLITVSSVLATRLARTREAVYYRVLGARSGFVVTVFGLENLILGALSGVLALLISQAASWVVITRVFDIAFAPTAAAGLMMIAGATALVTAAGLLPSWTILRQKPVAFLREQAHE